MENALKGGGSNGKSDEGFSGNERGGMLTYKMENRRSNAVRKRWRKGAWNAGKRAS